MADIPFVSEDFQRAFRNQFPSQTSTGRDLHVSDVVIPIVDFTPTASGASLPLELRQAANDATYTVRLNNISTVNTNLILTSGFFYVDFFANSDSASGEISLKSNDGSVATTIITYDIAGTNSIKDTFVYFNRVGNTFDIGAAKSSGTEISLNFNITPVADVNGNLTNPLGYSPQ
jgi:hypothetical protein